MALFRRDQGFRCYETQSSDVPPDGVTEASAALASAETHAKIVVQFARRERSR